MTMTSSSSNRIRNFRPASGFNIALEDDDDETDDEKSAVSSSSATAARLASSTVYRCGSTDVLGRELNISGSSSLSSSFTTTTDDQIVFQHAGLIIDLRSPAERNEKDAQRWMDAATAGSAQQQRPIHVFTIPINDDEESSSVIAELHEKIFDDTMNSQRRYVIRLDILNRHELLRYIQNNWLSSLKNSSAALLTEEFNKRGLVGLNEAILETKSGQIGLCRALQIMTIYREAIIMKKKKNNNRNNNNNNIQTNDDDDTSIVIHCVQGKDRTGMLVMLMQLLMGNTIISDEEIIEDYYRSNSNAVIKSKHCRRNEGSVTATASSAAAAAIVVVDGGGGNDNDNDKSLARIIKIDKRVFSGTNREAMISTLEGLRRRYGYNNDEGEDGSTRFGSFDRTVPRYFDLIGFNDSWRKRFRNVFIKKKKNNTGNNIRRSRL